MNVTIVDDVAVFDCQSLDAHLDHLGTNRGLVRVRLEDLWESIEVVESHGFRVERRVVDAGEPNQDGEAPVLLAVGPRPWWQSHRC